MISRPRRVRKFPQLARAAGRELCFVKDCPALMVLQSELEMLSRVDAVFNLFEESDAQLNCTSTGAATTGSAWRSRECRQTAGSINSATGSPIWHSRSSIGRSGRTFDPVAR